MEKRSEKWFSDDVPARLAEELLENLALNKSEENISIIKNAYDNYQTKYVLSHYSDPATSFCSLCGNGGVIDTTDTAISPKGIHTGRKNWCFCPNGVIHRRAEFEGELGDPNEDED